MHDIRLKEVKNRNKITYELDVEFDNGDTFDVRINSRGKSPTGQIANGLYEQVFSDYFGGDINKAVATDREVVEVIHEMAKALMEVSEKMIEATS